MSCLFKYYVSILGGGGGSRPMLIMLTQGGARGSQGVPGGYGRRLGDPIWPKGWFEESPDDS